MGIENAAAVNFSDLVNRNRETLALLKESPRLLLHRRGGEDMVLTTAARAEHEQAVVSAAARMLAALTSDRGADHGPVPDPRGVAWPKSV